MCVRQRFYASGTITEDGRTASLPMSEPEQSDGLLWLGRRTSTKRQRRESQRSRRTGSSSSPVASLHVLLHGLLRRFVALQDLLRLVFVDQLLGSREEVIFFLLDVRLHELK